VQLDLVEVNRLPRQASPPKKGLQEFSRLPDVSATRHNATVSQQPYDVLRVLLGDCPDERDIGSANNRAVDATETRCSYERLEATKGARNYRQKRNG
jgi:hypothetical protein